MRLLCLLNSYEVSCLPLSLCASVSLLSLSLCLSRRTFLTGLLYITFFNRKVFGIIDVSIRFISIICTGLTIRDLEAFKDKYLDEDDSFALELESVVDAGIARIQITMILQIVALLITSWWMKELCKEDKPSIAVQSLPMVATEVVVEQPSVIKG